jgi:ABC-type multidrug transport system fused ATPase/permease subunit
MKHLICIAKKYRYLMLLYLFMGFCRAFAQSFSSRYFQKIIDNFSSHSLKITHIAVYGSAIIALYVMCYLLQYPERKLELLPDQVDAARQCNTCAGKCNNNEIHRKITEKF